MLALIRYPFFGCVALFLAACGSSGSSTLFNPSPSMDADSGDGTTGAPSPYAAVDYLITNIPAARAKFVADPDAEMLADTDATAPARDAATLNTDRNNILFSGTRYLSTGAMLARTAADGTAMIDQLSSATCSDGATTGASTPANCVFEMDDLRDATTFHLGLTNTEDNVNDVGFRGFAAERQAVMDYRGVTMSQVRTADPRTADLKVIYEDGDGDGDQYLLTLDNVESEELTNETELPTGVTLDTAPDFADLFAVYEDEDGNQYLLTPGNITGMNLTDVDLPTGVTTAPAFAGLSRVTEDYNYEYVGYDGILEHSMFFVGIYRFFDDGNLQHARFENASIGQIYDGDTAMDNIQNPSVALTGKGVMVGVERRSDTLDHYLVQGDVMIGYTPDPALIDIVITNINRLNDAEDAWYSRAPQSGVLTWLVGVEDSEFTSPGSLTQGQLHGSFYGTETSTEVGGVFQHADTQYEIIGSFGSKVSEDDSTTQ